tara:strand:- start:11706 stop:12521 length:816 start_codon:yes stop_codon:yes gene_type:complete
MSFVADQVDTIKKIQKIFDIFINSEAEIRPHFILTGPSGSGKSFTIAELADQYNINCMEINAAQLTKEGTSGNSLSKALAPLLQYNGLPTICFVDEFDKLFISGNSNSSLAHETTNGVQNEFLKVLESDTTEVYGDFGKYVKASTENVLFVFAGAFNGQEDITLDDLREFGIKTEFLGRVGLAYNLPKITLDSLLQILENSRLLELYLQLFTNITKTAVVNALKPIIKQQYERNTLGVRMINTLIHQYFVNGGKIDQKVVKSTTFQKKLEL